MNSSIHVDCPGHYDYASLQTYSTMEISGDKYKEALFLMTQKQMETSSGAIISVLNNQVKDLSSLSNEDFFRIFQDVFSEGEIQEINTQLEYWRQQQNKLGMNKTKEKVVKILLEKLREFHLHMPDIFERRKQQILQEYLKRIKGSIERVILTN